MRLTLIRASALLLPVFLCAFDQGCQSKGKSGASLDVDSASCAQLYETFNEAMTTLDRSCDVDADCITIGGQASYEFCDPHPALGSHVGGTTAARVAFDASPRNAEILAIVAEWDTRCAHHDELCSYPHPKVPCQSDATQYPTKCVNHVCTEQGDSCISVHDAGP